MTCYEFGRKLLRTNDLDPVYVAAHHAEFVGDDEDEPDLHKWLLAYWCFYHVGTASWIVDQPDYWEAMKTAAGSKDWPRSSERRHFRGETARRSVEYLSRRGVFDLFSELITDAEPTTAEEVINSVIRWYGFGPWIAFKIADMLDRLAVRPVLFDIGTAMYEGSPTEATKILKDWEEPGWEPTSQKELSEWAVNRVLTEIKDVKAPPRFERNLGPQEAETILCKWKSYLGGHYHVGEDVESVRKGLLRFARCETSQILYQGGRKGGLW